MPLHNFKIGDIVALRTHPFNLNATSTIISGDSQTISPLMVIAEVLNDSKDLYDEVTGNLLSDKTQGQCRCIWYSNKSSQFEESWLSTKIIKIIEPRKVGQVQIKRDMMVTLKTHHLEMNKSKSTLTIDGDSNNRDRNKTNITPLLSFVSPIMQIIEIKKIEEKEPKFDSKTGNVRRYIPAYTVKCKWYNSISDKVSEKFLPIDVLEEVSETNLELIQTIQRIISSGQFLKVKVDDEKFSLWKPQNLSYRSGQYFLRGFDYIFNQIKEQLLENEESFLLIDTIVIKKCPLFDDFTQPKVSAKAKAELVVIIEEAVASKAFLRIVYRNRNEKVDTRTISNFEILLDEEGHKTYLKGFCFLRNDERTFRIERIQHLEMLNLSFDQ